MTTAANRLGLDYAKEARGFPKLDYPIIDVHSHLHGAEATRIYRRAAEAYGIGLSYTMTSFDQIDTVRQNLGDAVRFIAMPTFQAKDPLHAQGRGFLEQLEPFYEKGARIVKFWSAPRGIEMGTKFGQPDLLQVNAPHRIEAMKLARKIGYIFMVHVGDPDTWFKTKYADSSVYGTKRSHFDRLEDVLTRFDTITIGAHMGGWPENLDFLDTLLARYPHFYLDASATKWMVRELSRLGPGEVQDFLSKWSGRIMFGSDIITMDDHLKPKETDNEMQKKASTPEEAFDLYASRYWALRTLWETKYDGESPIADPDLHLVDPNRYSEMDAPRLRGLALPKDMLKMLYHDAAHQLLEPLYQDASKVQAR